MFRKLRDKIIRKSNDNEKSSKKLSSIFSGSPQKGIHEAQNYLMYPNFKNFDDFMNEVKKTQKSNCCITSWSKSMLSARCLDCQLHENSCICIPCYLAGKHDQHHSYLLGGSGSGNCDCGDPNFWKPSGNCPHHPGPDPNPDETQMTRENRNKFIEVFNSAYNAALTSKKFENCAIILDWLTSFISYGDGLRRCVAIAVTTDANLHLFNNSLKNMEEKPLTSLINLFGKLISDHHFARQMGTYTFRNYLLLRKIIKSVIEKGEYNKKDVPMHPVKKYLNFSFHFFNEIPLMHLITEYNFNWVDFILECLRFTFETVKDTKMDYQRNQDGHIISEMWYYSRLLEILMKKDDQHDNIQIFIDKYSQFLIEYERFYTFYYSNVPQDDSNNGYTSLFLFIYTFQINCIFSPNFDCSPNNKLFSISQTFSSLLYFLKLKKNLVHTSLFESKKIPVSTFIPLHHLFYCLLSQYPNPAQIVQIECKKNGISLQNFCNLVTICPLRILTAISVPERFSKLNQSTLRNITYCLDKPEETYNIFFGLLQTMVGIAPNKEQILHNIAITFGVFDEYPSSPPLPSLNLKKYQSQLMEYQKQKEMTESSSIDSSIFLMGLITDRSIITFDKILFKRLRVIEFLKNNKASSKDIETYVGDKLSNPIFGDDLQSYAERVNSSNGSFFRLKNDDDFTPFFPLIFRPNRTKILMKYTDKLVPIPEFVGAPRGLKMEKCLRTPIFLSLMHSCLTGSTTLSKQIGLAMFVEAVNNGDEFDLGSYEFANPIAIDAKDIFGVNDGLCQIYSKNDHFNFLTVKIRTNLVQRPTSIIEAVQFTQSLGIEALQKTNLPPVLRPKTDSEDKIEQKKKLKANQLKQQLIQEFENKRAQFSQVKNDENTNDDIENVRSSVSSLKTQNILCNICQTKLDDDILGFPCLSLPCLFPALIDNQLHKKHIPYDNMNNVFTMSICQHHVHYRCCTGLVNYFKDDAGHRNDKKTFKCMIDRGVRNCFLPVFPSNENEDDFQLVPKGVLKTAIDDFMKKAFLGLSKNDPLVPFKSYAGMVMIFEVRHRCRPECLDNPTVRILLRNLLLIYYFSLHGCCITEDIKDPLVKLIYMIVNSSSPKNEFKVFVMQISSSLSDDYLFEFLRRAAIIEDFALKHENENEKFVDWDEILSFDNLVQRYEIDSNKLSSIDLPLFETIPLADRFVGLYQPPFNLDIFDTSISRFIDLLTGEVVVFAKSYSTVKDKTDLPFIDDYVSSRYAGGLAMFLSLTGPNASDIIISCKMIDYLFNLDGFYVDQFGDSDRGFKRGAILSLSKDRLEKAVDKLLSGDVILY